MLVTYPETITMREARKIYFDANGFGDDGGYNDAWVDFKLGPIPMPFPNSKSRVKAVRYHDLHHLLTGYDTNLVGEFEISAWEIAAGCKSFVAAWALNLGGMAGGLVRSPRRVFAAFVRGRRERSLYPSKGDGQDFEALLDMTVGEARKRYSPSGSDVSSDVGRATLVDYVLYAIATLVGIVLALVQLGFALPLVPIGLITHAMRARSRSRSRATA